MANSPLTGEMIAAEIERQWDLMFPTIAAPPVTVDIVGPGSVRAVHMQIGYNRKSVYVPANDLTLSLAVFAVRYISPWLGGFIEVSANGHRKISVGSILFLKSGSPPLTVASADRGEIIDVEWFVGPEVRRDAFHRDCLTEFAPHAR